MSIWTEAQVENLKLWQNCNHVHPFTCVNRGDGNHPTEGGDHGILVPTVDGWVCPRCDYTQKWAHVFMLNGPPPPPFG